MNIQQLRAQIAALQDATMDKNKNFRSDYDEGRFDALTAVDALLDSLQEESVSEDLKDAMQRNAPDNIGVDDLLYWRNGFIAGAKWQQEKMEATAIDGRLCSTISGSEQNVVAPAGYGEYGKDGDKVKVIIIKDGWYDN